jgi:hypothetical protein
MRGGAVKPVRVIGVPAVLAAALILGIPASGRAQSRLLTRMGYVDMQRIMEAYIERFFTREIEWREHWERTGEVPDDGLREQMIEDIMQAVRRTAVVEGFSMVLDTTGSFVYGASEVDLTGKVLSRLESRLLDRLRGEPLPFEDQEEGGSGI